MSYYYVHKVTFSADDIFAFFLRSLNIQAAVLLSKTVVQLFLLSQLFCLSHSLQVLRQAHSSAEEQKQTAEGVRGSAVLPADHVETQGLNRPEFSDVQHCGGRDGGSF
jgi:hypothetical protein